MDLTVFLIVLIILSGFIKGFVGFGLSLILISVLLQSGFTPSELLPILVPLFVVLDIFLYIENRKHVKLDFKENFTLHYTTLMTLFVGILIGTYILTIINTDFLKFIFGILVLICVFFLMHKVNLHQMRVPKEHENGFFGLASGISTGLFTINAVPASLYLIYHQYPKNKYMGNLVTFLIFSDVILIAVYLFKGLFTVEGFLISLQLILLVLVGFFAGSYLRRKLPTKYFKAFVIGVLIISSLKMIYEYIMTLLL